MTQMTQIPFNQNPGTPGPRNPWYSARIEWRAGDNSEFREQIPECRSGEERGRGFKDSRNPAGNRGSGARDHELTRGRRDVVAVSPRR